MKRLWRRLDVRLFASYALVALVVIGALWVTVSLVAPAQFDNEFRATATAHEGAEEREAEGHTVFVSALRSSLPYALAASFAAAAIVSVLVARKILRPVRQVRSATRRLAAGHYDEPVEEPAELELAELARDVNLLAVQLQTTERRRARLIGEVAHEMRTPLTTIEGLVEGMLDEVFEPDEEVLTSLAEEATRLQRLASDLSELSRAEEGAIVLNLERVDLGELAEACANRLRPQYEDKHVELEVRAAPSLPVEVDPDRIMQVLTNLCGNALTYTPEGGRVTVTASRDGDVAQRHGGRHRRRPRGGGPRARLRPLLPGSRARPTNRRKRDRFDDRARARPRTPRRRARVLARSRPRVDLHTDAPDRLG